MDLKDLTEDYNRLAKRAGYSYDLIGKIVKLRTALSAKEQHVMSMQKRDRLEATGNVTGALELYRRCRHHDSAFSISRKTAAALAEHAASFGQLGLADELRQQKI